MNEQRIALTGADDTLLHQIARPFTVADNDTPTWFDRFYFSLHPPGPGPGPLLVLGAGVYPHTGVIDGYACVGSGDTQRNIRFSAPLGSDGRATMSVGALRWELLEPLRRWRLELRAPAIGVEADLVYMARTEPYSVQPVAVAHESGPRTEFWHFFQAGAYDGQLRIGEDRFDVSGWRGLRDRSWGVRRIRERLGIHLWGGVQFDDWCLSVHYNENRAGNPAHVDGAWLPIGDGAPVPVIALRHDLQLDAGGELTGGTIEADLEHGETITLAARALSRGIYMAAAGYGGWHGQPRGVVEEHDSLPLDGSVSPRSLSLGLVDKLCAYSDGQREGFGVFELAVSRSAGYHYRPTVGS